MIEQRNGQLIVTGALNQQTAPALLPAGEALVRTASLVVNLAAIEAVDSSALAVLLGWKRAALAAGQQLSIVEAPAAFMSLAELYGVTALLFPESDTGKAHSDAH